MSWLTGGNLFEDNQNRSGYGESFDYEYKSPAGYGDQPVTFNYESQYEEARYRDYESDPAPAFNSDYSNGSQYVSNYEEEPYSRSGDWRYGDGDLRYDESMYRTCDYRKSEATFGMEPSFIADEEVVEPTQEVLVTLRDAQVHLVDDQETLLLGKGEFSVVLIEQGGNGIFPFVRVGDDLRWPLTKDEPAVKLDDSHYFFTICVPRPIDEMDTETASDPSQEVITYGVTFPAEGQEESLQELDSILKNYNEFSNPKIVPVGYGAYGSDYGYDEMDDGLRIYRNETTPADSLQVTESKPADYWKAMSPNVDDYNSELAKTLASGTGSLIKGIFWLRNATVSNLDNGTKYVKDVLQPNPRGPSHISPYTINNLKRVMNLSKATEQVASSVLNGAIKVAGFFTGALLRTDTAKKIVQLLPGEAALASLDAFAKLFDALEVTGHDIAKKTAAFTQEVVKHRYGDEAGEVTAASLATAGHLFSTAWTVTKVRSAWNPVNFKPTTAGMLKAISKTVAEGERWAS